MLENGSSTTAAVAVAPPSPPSGPPRNTETPRVRSCFACGSTEHIDRSPGRAEQLCSASQMSVAGADVKQDGGSGNQGIILVVSSSCAGGSWWRVRWSNGHTNSYRVGCSGVFDLLYPSCPAAVTMTPSSPPSANLLYPENWYNPETAFESTYAVDASTAP
ncbi:hypothetical protein CYMTET_13786 [Cymbomonas tetramitiformis]|uniref:MIB/HERC2 domain-containing protein n=1 Tax=Cymbomonas tetramitiformis TaxID=36881 RepID=A0AAE0GIT4_9CHLO|nr:hypothetical protein CYMTET_13786 [Cymbomonas tetramitiformis]